MIGVALDEILHGPPVIESNVIVVSGSLGIQDIEGACINEPIRPETVEREKDFLSPGSSRI